MNFQGDCSGFAKKLTEKLKVNGRIIHFDEAFGRGYPYLYLVGGAVIDILEGRKPKDYDFIQDGSISKRHIDFFLNDGYDYVFETHTAITFKKDDITVQILKTKIEDFDFKISQTLYRIGYQDLQIDHISFKKKILIPTDFERQDRIINSLLRIPHWTNKNYKILDSTYKSLVNSINKCNQLNS